MFCKDPFECMIVNDRAFTTCHGGYLAREAQIPRHLVSDPWGAWNSSRTIKLRKAILREDFQYCQKCPKRHYERFDKGPAEHHKPIMESAPKKLDLLVDPTCNLNCWSCQNAITSTKTKEIHQRIVNQATHAWLPKIQHLVLRRGDPFASPIYRRLLQSIDAEKVNPKLGIGLCTNGLLLPRYWDSLEKAHSCMAWIKISVDAATKETYEMLRSPGKWEDIINALEFVADLRAAGVFKFVEIKFCCQSRNFREMPAFVRMAEGYGFDEVVLAPIRKWSLSQQDFDEVDMLRRDHPERDEFLKVLEAPELKHPMVKMGEFATGFLDHKWPWLCSAE